MLSNLNNTQFNNSTFVEYNQGTSGLDILLKHSTKEAAHDSYARESKDSCFPGTRTQYIQDITTWTTSTDQDQRYRLFWMQGPAGVGKTTIAQSCAEETAEYGALGASFFFSRDNGVVDPSRFFTTIAYQIATHTYQYKDIVEGRIRNDPTLVTKKLETQFKKLIIEPFLELERKGVELRQRAVFIDGLDECEGSTKQSTIVKLVAESIQTYGGRVPFLWAFFSRREGHLAQKFSDASVSPLCWQVELPVSREIDDEIKLYLCGTLRTPPPLANALNGSSDSSEWLSEEDLDKLVELSAGLFIYAATIAKFITDPESLGPKEQLREVLLFHSRIRNRSSRIDNHSNPMADLDAFYHLIMSRIPQKALPILQRLLLINHEWLGESGTLANISNLSLQALEEILSKLHPVLTLERRQRGSDGWGSASIFFYHASFMEFLVDRTRSKEFCIVNQAHWNIIVARSLRLLNGMYKMNGIDYTEKAPRLRKLLSAIPNTKSTCVAELLLLRDRLHGTLCWKIPAWCMHADLSDREVMAELQLVDFTMLRMVNRDRILSSDLANRLPEEVRLRSMCCVIPMHFREREQTGNAIAEDPPSFLAKADKTWGYISSFFDLLISGAMMSQDLEARFATFVYKTLTSGHLRRSGFNYLYSQINQYLLTRTQEWAKGSDFDSEKINLEFLNDYVDKWERYESVVGHVELIWSHWDSGFFQDPDEVGSKDASAMVRSAMLYWKTNMLSQKQTRSLALTKFVLGLLNQQRNGDLTNRVAVYVFVRSLISLGSRDVQFNVRENLRNLDVYKQYFENEFLQATRKYYAAGARAFLSENTLLAYLEHVEDRLLLESRIMEPIRLEERHPIYIKECKKSLTEDHLQLICREFEKLLGVGKSEEHLCRVYSLVSQVEATKELRTIFARHVKQVVSVSISRVLNQARDKSLSEPQDTTVSTLLTIHSQYLNLVQGVFKGDEGFRKCLDQAFDELCAEYPLIGRALCGHIQAAKLEEGHHDEPQNIANASGHDGKTSNQLPKHSMASTAVMRSHESLSHTEPTTTSTSTTSNSDVIEDHSAQMAPKTHTEDERGDVAVQDGKLEVTSGDLVPPPVSVHQTSRSRKRALSARF